jgi:hypothetical protein
VCISRVYLVLPIHFAVKESHRNNLTNVSVKHDAVVSTVSCVHIKGLSSFAHTLCSKGISHRNNLTNVFVKHNAIVSYTKYLIEVFVKHESWVGSLHNVRSVMVLV